METENVMSLPCQVNAYMNTLIIPLHSPHPIHKALSYAGSLNQLYTVNPNSLQIRYSRICLFAKIYV